MPSSDVPRQAFPLLRLGVFLLCIGALILLAVLAAELRWFRQFEHWTDDVRTTLLSDSFEGQHPDIAVVLVDDNTLRHFGITSRSPLDREMLSQIVGRVKRAGARAVGVDVFFLRPTTTAKDDALIAAFKDAAGAPVILGVADERVPMETWQRDYQASFLKRADRPAGFLNLRKETSDEVVRYHPSSAASPAYPLSFSLLLARASRPATVPAEGRRIAWLNPPADGTKHVFRTILAHDLFAFEGRSETSSVESGSQLKDRLVLIGANFVREDQHRTPFNIWKDEKMPGVMVHAHMVADLLAPQRAIVEASVTPVRMLIVVLGAGGLLLGWALSRNVIIDLLGWGFATVLLIGINGVAFYYWRTTFPFLLSVVAWVVGVAGGRSLAVLTEWHAGKAREAR